MIMGLVDYEDQQARLELLETLVASEQDVLEGRVAPLANTLQSLRDELVRGIS